LFTSRYFSDIIYLINKEFTLFITLENIMIAHRDFKVFVNAIKPFWGMQMRIRRVKGVWQCFLGG